MEQRGRRIAAVMVIVCSTAIGLSYLKARSQAELERVATARGLAAEVRRHQGQVCAGPLKRDWQYGLYYYVGAVLPSCDANPLPLQVLQTPGRPPRLLPAAPAAGTARPLDPVDPR